MLLTWYYWDLVNEVIALFVTISVARSKDDSQYRILFLLEKLDCCKFILSKKYYSKYYLTDSAIAISERTVTRNYLGHD